MGGKCSRNLTCSGEMPEKQNMPICSVTCFQGSELPDFSRLVCSRVRMSMMRSAMPFTSSNHCCLISGVPRMLSTSRAPWTGGLLYMALAIACNNPGKGIDHLAVPFFLTTWVQMVQAPAKAQTNFDPEGPPEFPYIVASSNQATMQLYDGRRTHDAVAVKSHMHSHTQAASQRHALLMFPPPRLQMMRAHAHVHANGHKVRDASTCCWA